MPYGQWWYRQVLAEHPASGVAAEARYRLGWSLTWDHPTEAIVHLKQVVATDSNERRLADGLLALGIAYGALREYEAARAAYAELLARGQEACPCGCPASEALHRRADEVSGPARPVDRATAPR